MQLDGRRLLIVDDDRELARLVGASAERHGARVMLADGGDEALAALEAWPADAAIVDLPLAGGDARALLSLLARRGAPAVAVSGIYRGPRGEADVRALGAARLFEKPFPVEGLLAALSDLLAAADLAAGAAPAPSPGPAAPWPAPDEAALDEELADFDSLVFSQARPALDELVPRPHLRSPVEGLAAPLPGLAPTPAPVSWRARLPPLPEGALSRAPVPRLLAVLHTGRATGALSLRQGAQRRLVLLEDGAPVFATSNAAAERFGACCVREGLLDAAALAGIVRGLAPGETTAAALLARGIVDPARRARIVADQVAGILWGTFGWREGTYRVAPGHLPARERLPLRLDVGNLVLEGMRRGADLAQLRAELPGETALAPTADAPFELHALELRSREAEMLAHADGTKAARDLVALSGLVEREALAVLQGCRHLGLLDEVARVLASTRRIGFM